MSMPSASASDRGATPAGATLELERAAIRLGQRTILNDVSLSVGPGEFIGVLGANGAGKSTLMRAILGLVPLAAGTIRVLGGPPASARGRIGYLPQRHGFDRGTRIRGIDLVQLGLDGARWGLPIPLRPAARERRRDEHRRVREVIALTGAEAYAERPIGELSGGEQQRLLIAAALVRRPRLLILDEPLDSLDLPNQAAVARLVANIAAREGVSVLLVAHDVNPLLPHLHRVIYLAGGHAVAGPVRETITSPTLSALYGVPIEVLETHDGRLVVVGAPDAPHHHGHHHP
jgi:zinc/manganese transport system ATP-binding protein